MQQVTQITLILKRSNIPPTDWTITHRGPMFHSFHYTIRPQSNINVFNFCLIIMLNFNRLLSSKINLKYLTTTVCVEETSLEYLVGSNLTIEVTFWKCNSWKIVSALNEPPLYNFQPLNVKSVPRALVLSRRHQLLCKLLTTERNILKLETHTRYT